MHCALTWTSQLEVAGGVGQVVFNGTAGAYPGSGLWRGRVAASCGDNRVEAQLVQGSGRPGTWRFDLSEAAVAPGSLRPVAGRVTLVTRSAVVFQLSGSPGERVAFLFRTRR